MIGLVLAAAAVGAVAGQLEVNPSVTAESRAGEAPTVYGGAPEGSLVEVLTPGAELAYVGRRLELRASYELRIFWRSTSETPHPSPLYLNTVNLGMTAHATPRLTLKLSGSAFEGEADYTYLPNLYGQSQATLLVVPKIFAANVAGSAELHLTRLVTAGLALQASHSQPIGDSHTTAAVPSGPTAVYTLPHLTGQTLSTLSPISRRWPQRQVPRSACREPTMSIRPSPSNTNRSPGSRRPRRPPAPLSRKARSRRSS